MGRGFYVPRRADGEAPGGVFDPAPQGSSSHVIRRGPSSTRFAPQTVTCRVFGCRWRFGADGPVLSWWCARGCPSGGEKTYPTVELANRMADAMDPEPRRPLGFLALLGGTQHREPRDRSKG